MVKEDVKDLLGVEVLHCPRTARQPRIIVAPQAIPVIGRPSRPPTQSTQPNAPLAVPLAGGAPDTASGSSSYFRRPWALLPLVSKQVNAPDPIKGQLASGAGANDPPKAVRPIASGVLGNRAQIRASGVAGNPTRCSILAHIAFVCQHRVTL